MINEFEYFESKEEVYFYWWLKELEKRKLIYSIEYQPKPFQLSDKVFITWGKQLKTKVKKQSTLFLDEKTYTADFLFYWNEKLLNKLFMCFDDTIYQSYKNFPFIANKSKKNGQYFSVVDIKGTFDEHNMQRIFSIDQKWIFQKYRIYVQKIITHPMVTDKGKIIPATALFPNTFIPERFILTDNKQTVKGKFKSRKINYDFLLIDGYLKQLNIQV